MKKFFYSSSACIYPEYNQLDPDNPKCSEESAYPAAPDSEYGWEKLFSERLYLAYIAESRAFMCGWRASTISLARKVRGAAGGKRRRRRSAARWPRREDGGEIEIWGDGKQTRSFLYIDECVEGVRRLMDSRLRRPGEYWLGRDGDDQPVWRSIIMEIAGKKMPVRHIPGPLGVRGRNSDNRLIREQLGWAPGVRCARAWRKLTGGSRRRRKRRP